MNVGRRKARGIIKKKKRDQDQHQHHQKQQQQQHFHPSVVVSFSVSWVSPDRRPAALAPFPLDLLSLLRPPFCLMRGSFDGRSWPSFSTLLPLCGALCALLRSRRYLESRLLIGLLIGLLIDAAHNFWPLTCDW